MHELDVKTQGTFVKLKLLIKKKKSVDIKQSVTQILFEEDNSFSLKDY